MLLSSSRPYEWLTLGHPGGPPTFEFNWFSPRSVTITCWQLVWYWIQPTVYFSFKHFHRILSCVSNGSFFGHSTDQPPHNGQETLISFFFWIGKFELFQNDAIYSRFRACLSPCTSFRFGAKFSLIFHTYVVEYLYLRCFNLILLSNYRVKNLLTRSGINILPFVRLVLHTWQWYSNLELLASPIEAVDVLYLFYKKSSIILILITFPLLNACSR